MMLFLSFIFFFGNTGQVSPDVIGLPWMAKHKTSMASLLHLENKMNSQHDLVDHYNNADSLTYTATKTEINLLRERLRFDIGEKRIDIDSVKRSFGDCLINKIIPYWYGTGWSFSGHTAVPKEGKIACGYFVSTTLKDMGLQLNRYKLAQKSPIDEATAISCGTEITTISHDDPEDALAEIKGHIKKGVYFIGFDKGHVGFLIKKNDALLLVHSNYLSPGSVCIEPLASAKVFKTFTKFHLVNISHNEKLMQKWLNSEVVL